MHKSTHQSSDSQNSSHTPVKSLLQPRPFALQAQTEPTSGELDKPELQSDQQKFKGETYGLAGILMASNSGSPPKKLQPKLKIGKVGDRYEQEADRTASEVVRAINQPIQKKLQRKSETQFIQDQGNTAHQTQKPFIKPFNIKSQDEIVQQKQDIASQPRNSFIKALRNRSQDQSVQRKEAIGGGTASADLESSIQGARGGGQALDPNLQQSMGQAMGADFSGVKVHTDSQSDQLNKSIQAKAFTTGQDVFFRQGAYEPSSRGGQELIAHELTHVVQQNGGAVQRKSEQISVVTVGSLSASENLVQRNVPNTTPNTTPAPPYYYVSKQGAEIYDKDDQLSLLLKKGKASYGDILYNSVDAPEQNFLGKNLTPIVNDNRNNVSGQLETKDVKPLTAEPKASLYPFDKRVTVVRDGKGYTILDRSKTITVGSEKCSVAQNTVLEAHEDPNNTMFGMDSSDKKYSIVSDSINELYVESSLLAAPTTATAPNQATVPNQATSTTAAAQQQPAQQQPAAPAPTTATATNQATSTTAAAQQQPAPTTATATNQATSTTASAQQQPAQQQPAAAPAPAAPAQQQPAAAPAPAPAAPAQQQPAAAPAPAPAAPAPAQQQPAAAAPTTATAPTGTHRYAAHVVNEPGTKLYEKLTTGGTAEHALNVGDVLTTVNDSLEKLRNGKIVYRELEAENGIKGQVEAGKANGARVKPADITGSSFLPKTFIVTQNTDRFSVSTHRSKNVHIGSIKSPKLTKNERVKSVDVKEQFGIDNKGDYHIAKLAGTPGVALTDLFYAQLGSAHQTGETTATLPPGQTRTFTPNPLLGTIWKDGKVYDEHGKDKKVTLKTGQKVEVDFNMEIERDSKRYVAVRLQGTTEVVYIQDYKVGLNGAPAQATPAQATATATAATATDYHYVFEEVDLYEKPTSLTSRLNKKTVAKVGDILEIAGNEEMKHDGKVIYPNVTKLAGRPQTPSLAIEVGKTRKLPELPAAPAAPAAAATDETLMITTSDTKLYNVTSVIPRDKNIGIGGVSEEKANKGDKRFVYKTTTQFGIDGSNSVYSLGRNANASASGQNRYFYQQASTLNTTAGSTTAAGSPIPFTRGYIRKNSNTYSHPSLERNTKTDKKLELGDAVLVAFNPAGTPSRYKSVAVKPMNNSGDFDTDSNTVVYIQEYKVAPGNPSSAYQDPDLDAEEDSIWDRMLEGGSSVLEGVKSPTEGFAENTEIDVLKNDKQLTRKDRVTDNWSLKKGDIDTTTNKVAEEDVLRGKTKTEKTSEGEKNRADVVAGSADIALGIFGMVQSVRQFNGKGDRLEKIFATLGGVSSGATAVAGAYKAVDSGIKAVNADKSDQGMDLVSKVAGSIVDAINTLKNTFIIVAGLYRMKNNSSPKSATEAAQLGIKLLRAAQSGLKAAKGFHDAFDKAGIPRSLFNSVPGMDIAISAADALLSFTTAYIVDHKDSLDSLEPDDIGNEQIQITDSAPNPNTSTTVPLSTYMVDHEGTVTIFTKKYKRIDPFIYNRIYDDSAPTPQGGVSIKIGADKFITLTPEQVKKIKEHELRSKLEEINWKRVTKHRGQAGVSLLSLAANIIHMAVPLPAISAVVKGAISAGKLTYEGVKFYEKYKRNNAAKYQDLLIAGAANLDAYRAYDLHTDKSDKKKEKENINNVKFIFELIGDLQPLDVLQNNLAAAKTEATAARTAATAAATAAMARTAISQAARGAARTATRLAEQKESDRDRLREAALAEQLKYKKVKAYIQNTGVDEGLLYSKNGKPEEQITMLITALKSR
jgi:hypothetical protein